MICWEYHVATFPGVAQVLQAALTDAGAEGWELVTCEYHQVRRCYWVLVFKRPAPVPTDSV